MKGAAAVSVFLVFSVVILLPFSLSTRVVLAQDSYSIQSVDHEVEILYSGHVVIRDTIHLSGQFTGDFFIGFPYKYGSYLLKGMAYDSDTVFKLKANRPAHSKQHNKTPGKPGVFLFPASNRSTASSGRNAASALVRIPV